MRASRMGRLGLSMGALGASLLLGGCEFLFGSDEEIPAEAEITVEGEATAPLLLVVSKDFEIVYNNETGGSAALLYLADTTEVQPASLPYNIRIDIPPENRLLARVVNPAADTALVRLLVRLDGRVGHDRTLRIADSQYVEYTTTY